MSFEGRFRRVAGQGGAERARGAGRTIGPAKPRIEGGWVDRIGTSGTSFDAAPIEQASPAGQAAPSATAFETPATGPDPFTRQEPRSEPATTAGRSAGRAAARFRRYTGQTGTNRAAGAVRPVQAADTTEPDTIEPGTIEAYREARARTRPLKKALRWASLVALAPLAALPILAVAAPFVGWQLGWAAFVTGLLVFAFLGVVSLVILAEFAPSDEIDEDQPLLARTDLPETFEILDTLCRAAGTAPLDAVMILPEVNAFAMQEEAGEQRRVLGLGAPLLILMEPERALAVIAHEIAHFAQEDTTENRLADRALGAYAFIGEMIDNHGLLAPVGWLLSLSGRALHAVHAKSSRANEFAADAFAAALVGRRSTGEALTLIGSLAGDAERAAWKPLDDAYESGHELPRDLIGTLPRRLQQVYNEERMNELLNERGDHRTGWFDSHPALKERLGALGQPFVLPAIAPGRGSWSGFLGAALPRTVERMEALYRKRFGETFTERARDVAGARPLVETALRAIDAAPDYESQAEAAEVAALLIERSMPFAEMRETLEGLYTRFARLIPHGDTVRVAAPTAAAMLLDRHLRDADTRALEPAIDLLRVCPMMARDLVPLLGALVWGEVGGDLKPLQKALRADARLLPAARGALEAFDAETDVEDYFAGLGRLPFEPHGLADWHIDLIARELSDWVAKADSTLTEAWMVREPEGRGGMPAFHILYRVTEMFEWDEMPLLSPRLCTPGTVGHFQLTESQTPRARLKAIVAVAGEPIYRAPQVDPERAPRAA